MAEVQDPDKPELKDLICDLRGVNDWLNFGVCLGLEHSLLTRLEKQYHYDISRCRTEMLQLWLDSNSNPTWSEVIDALKDVGCEKQAMEIISKRSGGHWPFSKDNTIVASIARPSQSPEMHHGLPSIQSPSGEHSVFALSPYATLVSHSNFHHRRQRRSSQNPYPPERPPFVQRRPIAQHNNPQLYPLPITAVDSTDCTQLCQYLPEEACRKMSELKDKFASLLDRQLEILEQSKVTVTRIRLFIRNLPISERNPELMFQGTDLEKISNATTVGELFDIIADYFTFDNYFLLDRLVKQYSTLEGKKLMQEYVAELNQFQQECKAVDYANAYIRRNISADSPSLRLHVDNTWQQHSFFALRELHQSAFPVAPYAYSTMDVYESSICIEFITTQSVVDELCKGMVGMFSYLKSQAVLNISVGNNEMDLTSKEQENVMNPNLQVSDSDSTHTASTASVDRSLLKMTGTLAAVSLTSEDSEHSRRTKKSFLSERSKQSGESGYVSVAPSFLSLSSLTEEPSDVVLSALPYVKVVADYIPGIPHHLEVHVGQKLKIMQEKDGWATAVTSEKQTGIVPCNCYSHAAMPCTEMVDDSVGSRKLKDEDEEVVRPDTPPAIALKEAESICLTDFLNQHPPPQTATVHFSKTLDQDKSSVRSLFTKQRQRSLLDSKSLGYAESLAKKIGLRRRFFTRSKSSKGMGTRMATTSLDERLLTSHTRYFWYLDPIDDLDPALNSRTADI